jgi:hypothetical protein
VIDIRGSDPQTIVREGALSAASLSIIFGAIPAQMRRRDLYILRNMQDADILQIKHALDKDHVEQHLLDDEHPFDS